MAFDACFLFLFASATGSMAFVALCAIAGTVAWLAQWKRVRETTLFAPWIWAGASLLCLCLVHGWLTWQTPATWHGHLRYAAAATTTWPLMALLGAKRPQDRGWQFIVISLWLVMLLPAGQSLLHSRGAALELADPWKIFVAGLVGLGLVNGLPTARWPAAAAVSIARALLFVPAFVPPGTWNGGVRQTLTNVGLLLFVSSFALELLSTRRRRPAQPIDRVWLDFRDAYGLLWGLRVGERFNASARQLGWGMLLRWRGLDVDEQSPAREISPETAVIVRQNLQSLLRRFVSDEWFDARWNDRLE